MMKRQAGLDTTLAPLILDPSAIMDPNLPPQQMTRRFFLRASSATLLAAPLFPTLPIFSGPWRFFNDSEGETLTALCERIIPADEDPGAAWAGVAHFIDINLTGYYRRYQSLYRVGLTGVGQSSMALGGKAYVALSAPQQDEVLRKLESNQAPGETWKHISAVEFFNRLVDHSLQGFYGGPRHGGNRDAISWRMLGLPVAPVRSRRPLTADWAASATPPSEKP